ncbi:ARM repeat-containing protein [Serendipita vermifera]|nr:ARM repeat-containing protein [Serendipita vermifera]
MHSSRSTSASRQTVQSSPGFQEDPEPLQESLELRNAPISSSMRPERSSSHHSSSSADQYTPQSEAKPRRSATPDSAAASGDVSKIAKSSLATLGNHHASWSKDSNPNSAESSKSNAGNDSKYLETGKANISTDINNRTTSTTSKRTANEPVDQSWKAHVLQRDRSNSPARSPPRANALAPKQTTPDKSVIPKLVEPETVPPESSSNLDPNSSLSTESVASSHLTSQSARPRSPVLSPQPRSLLQAATNPRRDRSPVTNRNGSPYAQSISPVPGQVSESGSGIMSPRGPVQSPAASPSAEITNPLSPRSTTTSLPVKVDEVDPSSSSSEDMSTPLPRRNNETSNDYFQETSDESTPTESSPFVTDEEESVVQSPPSGTPPLLQIVVPEREMEITDDVVMVDHQMAQMDDEHQQAMILDDEGLTPLERIYLYSRSNFTFHRIYISKQLPFLIREVSPAEAVDYVCPLLNGLGTDPEETVKEVFVQELVPIMWWFFMNCQVVDHEDPIASDIEDVTYLPSNAFTPLIGSLLLSANPRVGDGARLAIVDLLNRLQDINNTPDDPRYGTASPVARFEAAEKEIIMNEIMNGVVLGMGRLDSEFQEGDQSMSQATTDEHMAQQALQRSGAPSPEDRPGQYYKTSDESFTYQPISRRDSLEDIQEDDESQAEDEPVPQLQPAADWRQNSIDEDGWVTAAPTSTTGNYDADPFARVEPKYGEENPDPTSNEGEPAPQDTSEEATVGRVASMSVVAAIAANATMPPRMQEVFVQEVRRVGSDSVYWVRREASFAIGALAKVVPLEMVMAHLLPLYESLVQDEQWHVRHSILFALPGILARIDAVQRRLLTVPSLLRLSQDSADPVRSGLLEVLGEVIYTFRDDPGGPPKELIDLFVPDPSHWEVNTNDNEQDASAVWFSDPERPIICAFNFPAVVLTLGPERWPDVRGYYLHLSENPTAKVFRTLAASLGEVAAIIGTTNAEKDLLPIFLSSLRSSEPEVRGKIIEALPKFAHSVSQAKREVIAQELRATWGELGSWREREQLARLVGDFIELVGERSDSMADITSQALRDEVAAVREAGINSLPSVLKALAGKSLRARVFDDLLLLASSELYRQRATFVSCALSLARDVKDAKELEKLPIWKLVKSLAQDPIVDVRIGIARLVANICERFYPSRRTRSRYITELVKCLMKDEYPQVQAYVSFLVRDEALSPIPDSPDTTQRMFAVFSKPPRVVARSPPSPTGDRQIDDLITGVTERMDLNPVDSTTNPPDITVTSEAPQSAPVTSNETNTTSTNPPEVAVRPQLLTADSTESAGSGTSRGEESQRSVRNPGDESPRTRPIRPRRNNNFISLSDLSYSVDMSPEGMQSSATTTPSPGSERRISFDTISNHSDSSDSSGRHDPIPLVRRSSLHRMPSDPVVSVASG